MLRQNNFCGHCSSMLKQHATVHTIILKVQTNRYKENFEFTFLIQSVFELGIKCQLEHLQV